MGNTERKPVYNEKRRAPRNRTLILTDREKAALSHKLLRAPVTANAEQLADQIICGDFFTLLPQLPNYFVDLLIVDPPYNLTKRFGAESFHAMPLADYEEWFESWFVRLMPLLKPTASIYVCGDWKSSAAVHRVLDRRVIVRNRITWEREKGRGSKTNWKNASEDIWFATVSDDYCFNVKEVMLKRRVIAPYRVNGHPKGWDDEHDGQFRLTHPSNIWTDLTIPFWSMSENTEHPTQKPEKLLAKLLLASSRENDFVFDPFLGSGTTGAVARKLGRHFLGIECDEDHACLSLKRAELAVRDHSIQGYNDGVFWERNSLNVKSKEVVQESDLQPTLFGATKSPS